MKKSQHHFKLTIVTSIIGFCGLAVLQSCSSNSSGGGTTTTTTSSFAGTLAEDMMIASPTVHRTSSRSLNSDFAKPVYRVANGVHVLDADSTPEAKETAALALINATSEASCDISLQINQSVNANCYGPSVSYTNHPAAPGSPSSWPSGDLGIWENTESGSSEACSATQLNSRMKGVASLVDVGMFTMAGMACVAKTKGHALPTVSANIDLTINKFVG